MTSELILSNVEHATLRQDSDLHDLFTTLNAAPSTNVLLIVLQCSTCYHCQLFRPQIEQFLQQHSHDLTLLVRIVDLDHAFGQLLYHEQRLPTLTYVPALFVARPPSYEYCALDLQPRTADQLHRYCVENLGN